MGCTPIRPLRKHPGVLPSSALPLQVAGSGALLLVFVPLSIVEESKTLLSPRKCRYAHECHIRHALVTCWWSALRLSVPTASFPTWESSQGVRSLRQSNLLRCCWVNRSLMCSDLIHSARLRLFSSRRLICTKHADLTIG